MKELSEESRDFLLKSIRDVEDFPKKGIVFKDITTLLNSKEAFNLTIKHLVDRYKDIEIDYIAGAESRGFIFGAPLAYALGAGFVPIRKKGKLPYTTVAEKYALEYGHDEIEIHIDAFGNKKGAKVLFIDDLIATGGTAEASVKLIKQSGAECVEACFLIKLAFLEGDAKLKELTSVYSMLEV